jgi:hypothetical protein
MVRAMKRDKDLVRAILLKLEEQIGLHGVTYNFNFLTQKLSVPGYTDDMEVYTHLKMLVEDSPYVEGRIALSGEIIVKAITWSGRDFLDSIRDPTIWEETKKGAEKVGGFSLELLGALAKGLIKKKIEEHTGVQLDL